MEMGVECGWGWGELRDSDVTLGGHDGPSEVHVCDRTVQSGPALVRTGTPQHIHACQRLRFSRYTLFLFFYFFVFVFVVE